MKEMDLEMLEDVTGGNMNKFIAKPVGPNDNWNTMADKFGVSVAELKHFNPQFGDKPLRISSILSMPRELVK